MCVCYVLFRLVFISASVPLPDERNDTLELENQQRLIKTLETITNQLKRTLSQEPMYSFQLASEMLVADSNSLETEKAFLFCRPGSVLRGRMCGKTFPCNKKYLARSGSSEMSRASLQLPRGIEMKHFAIVVWFLFLLFCLRPLSNHQLFRTRKLSQVRDSDLSFPYRSLELITFSSISNKNNDYVLTTSIGWLSISRV